MRCWGGGGARKILSSGETGHIMSCCSRYMAVGGDGQFNWHIHTVRAVPLTCISERETYRCIVKTTNLAFMSAHNFGLARHCFFFT